jgi:hypothetical protein
MTITIRTWDRVPRVRVIRVRVRVIRVRVMGIGYFAQTYSCRGAKQDGTAVAEDDSGGSDFVCGWSRAEKTSDGVSAVAGAVVPGKAPEAPPLGLPEEGIS